MVLDEAHILGFQTKPYNSEKKRLEIVLPKWKLISNVFKNNFLASILA